MNWRELKQASIDDILAWAESQPWCRAMADCAQDAEWHSEGGVWTHTKMVCQQLAELEAWPTLTSDEQAVLIFTALFHDAAKPLTSEVDHVSIQESQRRFGEDHLFTFNGSKMVDCDAT